MRCHPVRLMPIRVVLIGDLPAGLGQQIAALPASLEFEVVGICADRASSHEALHTLAPDVALVSSQLVDASGFELVAELSPRERPPAVVFLSAREEDAVRAFEVHATDFVVIPVLASRLDEAMHRARHQSLQAALLRTAEELQRLIGATATSRAGLGMVAASTGAMATAGHGATLDRDGAEWRSAHADGADAWRARDQGPELVSSHAASGDDALRTVSRWNGAGQAFAALTQASSARAAAVSEEVLDLAQVSEPSALRVADGRPKRVLVREGRRTRFIALSEVDWFEADGNYILVHVAEQQYRTRGTISAIESGLDPRQFVRIHRRMVVNMDRVREMSPLPGGDGLLVLGSGTTLRLSRTYRARVR
jgi:two-component system, LytTR family, response regulator